MSDGRKNSLEVLILSYNHADYIEKAISSAFAQEDESVRISVSVIDDGSSDRTPEILDELESRYGDKLRIVRKEHSGVRAIAGNLNELIRDAKADYVAFLASDDYFLPGTLSRCVGRLSETPDAALLIAQGQNEWDGGEVGPALDEKTIEVISSEDPSILEEFVTSRVPVIYLQGTLAKRNFLSSEPVFDPDLIADDWVFFIRSSRRMIKSGRRFIFEKSIIFSRTFHGENTSLNSEVHFERVCEVASKYLNKRDSFRVIRGVSFSRWRKLYLRLGFQGSFGAFVDYAKIDPMFSKLLLFYAKSLHSNIIKRKNS